MNVNDLETGKKYIVANMSSIYEGTYTGATSSAAPDFAEFVVEGIEQRLYLNHYWQMTDFDEIQNFIEDQLGHWKWMAEKFRLRERESETVAEPSKAELSDSRPL